MRKAVGLPLAVMIMVGWVMPLIAVRYPIRWLALREGVPPKRILLHGWDACTLAAIDGMNTIVRIARWANPNAQQPFIAQPFNNRGRHRG